MDVREIPLSRIEISEFNTRKNLEDGQYDSTVQHLAASIERQSLLNPIHVMAKQDGVYALIAGQRRYLAFKFLGRTTIPAVVISETSEAEATAMSLVENVHRADMNPLDKARAFALLRDRLGDEKSVSRETGTSVPTVRKYIDLLDLAPQLQTQLAAGEAKGTSALARLAKQVRDPDQQAKIWKRIDEFTQDVQQDILKGLDPDLGNLDELVDDAVEGRIGYRVVRDCPWDCPTLPSQLKPEVARLLEAQG